MAAAILRADLKPLLDELWKTKSLPPSWVGRLTPYEFHTLFFQGKPASDADEPGDKKGSALAALTSENHERGQSGRLPVITPSLLPLHNPRRRRDSVKTPDPHSGVAPLAMVPAAPVGPVRR